MNTFNARDYLNTYYTQMDDENQELIQFWSTLPVNPHGTVLEVGCGPTIFTAIPLHNNATLMLTDTNEENLNELELWLRSKPGAFNWDPVIAYYVQHYHTTHPHDPPLSVDRVKKVLRRRLQIAMWNIFEQPPSQPFDVITAPFSLAEIAKNKLQFFDLFDRLKALLKAGGILGIATGLNGKYYKCGPARLHMTGVTFSDVLRCYRTFTEVHIRTIGVQNYRGYERIMAVWGRL